METVLFIISKVVAPFFSPLFLILLVILVLLVRMRRNIDNRRVRFWLLVLWSVAFLASSPLVSELLVRAWEVPVATELPDGPAPSPRWDSVLVLGGGVDPNRSAGWQISVNDAADRLEAAARLYQQGMVRTVVLSGGSGDVHNQDKTEGPLLKRLLTGMGVPESAILMEDRSRNTFENARYGLELVRQAGGTRLLLLTSALHMRRSEAIFRKALPAGIQLETLAVDTRSQSIEFPDSFIPNAWSLDRLSKVLREMAGYLSYLVLGRL